MSVKYDFGAVHERDMDVLIAQSLGADEAFCRIFINKVPELSKRKYTILSVELSKSDEDGESDITVIIDVDGKKIGLLIEDKIDASARPAQYERYQIRGDKGVKNKEYKEYKVFICCPKKYHEGNSEAKKYDYYVSYEECMEYFEKKNNSLAISYIQQFKQAIKKSKTSNVTINEQVNEFFIGYSNFQRLEYPELNLTTKTTSNGYWAYYKTGYEKSFIYHRIKEGIVYLGFDYASNNEADLKCIANILKQHGIGQIYAKSIGTQGALVINVPPMDMEKDFHKDISESDKRACFNAIQKLNDFALILKTAHTVATLKKK